MKSNTSIVARQYRIQQWAAQIQECNNRPDGVSIKDLKRKQTSIKKMSEV